MSIFVIERSLHHWKPIVLLGISLSTIQRPSVYKSPLVLDHTSWDLCCLTIRPPIHSNFITSRGITQGPVPGAAAAPPKPAALLSATPFLALSAGDFPPVASQTRSTSSRSSGMAAWMWSARMSRKDPKACILPRISWLPRRTSSTNSRV